MTLTLHLAWDSSSLVSCNVHPHTGLSLLAVSLQGQGDFTSTCTVHLALVCVLGIQTQTFMLAQQIALSA